MKHLERGIDGQNQWWKLLLNSIVPFLASNFIGGIILLGAVVYYTMQAGYATKDFVKFVNNPEQVGMPHNLHLLLMLFPFVVALFFLWLSVKGLHRRSFSEVINGTVSLRWRRIWTGAGCWTIISVLYLLIDRFLIAPQAYQLQFDWHTFLPLVLVTLLFIPLQTTFEEFLLRGYLTQSVGAISRYRIPALIIPAAIFALLHFFNPEVKEYGFGLSMVQYFSFGLLFGLLTILDDGAELSMGAHAANNVFLCLFVTNDSSALVTNAVYKQMEVFPMKETIVLITMGIVMVLILSRKYRWDFSVLLRKVELPEGD